MPAKQDMETLYARIQAGETVTINRRLWKQFLDRVDAEQRPSRYDIVIQGKEVTITRER